MKGVFITLEGPEGSGKTTLISRLAQAAQGDFDEVLVTREPGDGPAGPSIRKVLLEGSSLDPWTETFLFLADRAQHCREVIRPALGRGALVLCDRFADSTLAYQGYARGLNIEVLRQLNDLATGEVRPDLTLLLDLDPSVGLNRLGAKDRLDQEPIEFHRAVREGFLAESRRDPGRYRVLDASLSADEVFQAALQEMRRLFEPTRL